MTTPQITQIIRRTDQGATRPFICRADDGNVYYVKGRSASTGERIREWMGTHLATAFGLPVPPMCLLEIPDVLIRSSGDDAAHDLGTGYAVGSRQILAASELRHDEIPLVPANIQQSVLLFDFWVQNEDRTLSDLGGNPNLLWNKATTSLHAIDYNLILPNAFDVTEFWQTHVFRHAFAQQGLDEPHKQQFEQRMQRALATWQQAWDQLPEEWLDENQATGSFDGTTVLKRLEHDATGAIWEEFNT
jgi:hypothetical protein